MGQGKKHKVVIIDEGAEMENDGELSGTAEALVLAEMILDDALKYANKFVKKVETGRARSKETYADLKDLKTRIEKYKNDREV